MLLIVLPILTGALIMLDIGMVLSLGTVIGILLGCYYLQDYLLGFSSPSCIMYYVTCSNVRSSNVMLSNVIFLWFTWYYLLIS
jgi:hypothetical protein